MFEATIKKTIECYQPNGVYDIARTLHLVMKLAGFFPIKIEETKTGPKPVICKFGVLSTILHLLLYLIPVTHMIVWNNEKMSLDVNKIADYGYLAILVLQGVTTLVFFSSVIHMMKFQTAVIKYTTQMQVICHQLKIDNTAVFLKSRCLIGLIIVFFTMFYLLGAGIFIHTQYVSMHGVPPIDLILVGILPNFYLLIKITCFSVYILSLHVCNIEFYKFMELYLNDI